jgi:hypothetical protein
MVKEPKTVERDAQRVWRFRTLLPGNRRLPPADSPALRGSKISEVVQCLCALSKFWKAGREILSIPNAVSLLEGVY